MQQAQLLQIATALEGGFFGGVINVNGQHKGVIWSPKKPGSFPAVLLDDGKTVTDAGSASDCLANTKALLAAGSHAAEYVTGLTINGFQDWLIPSRDVLELGYRHFKPTTDTNWRSWRDGENANSIPPGWLYTSHLPGQTQLDAFKSGGNEAFDSTWHWSSTALPDGKTAVIQTFRRGTQYGNALSAECRVRAVRLIQL